MGNPFAQKVLQDSLDDPSERLLGVSSSPPWGSLGESVKQFLHVLPAEELIRMALQDFGQMVAIMVEMSPPYTRKNWGFFFFSGTQRAGSPKTGSFAGIPSMAFFTSPD